MEIDKLHLHYDKERNKFVAIDKDDPSVFRDVTNRIVHIVKLRWLGLKQQFKDPYSGKWFEIAVRELADSEVIRDEEEKYEK
jgi:hypothetical protein